MPAVMTAQVGQDGNGNIGVAMHSQAGVVRRIPLMAALVNVDSNGNIGVFAQGGGGMGDPITVASMSPLAVTALFNRVFMGT